MYRYAVQTLRATHSIIVNYRETLLKRGIVSSNDKDISYAITASSVKVSELRLQIFEQCNTFEHEIAMKLRS